MSSVSHNIEDFESLLVTLQNSLGVVVSDEQRGDLVERIEPLLSAHQLDSLASLAASIEGDHAEEIKSEILDALSNGQSSWYLSPEMKRVLHDYIFEQLPENAKIWIVGCGQGQLAYSVAMEVAEYENETGTTKNFELIATDVLQSNIKYAESATYSKQQLDGLSEEYKKLFVTLNAKDGSGKIKEKIRQLLSFRQCDLKDDFQSLEPMDIIICPEALVYFSNSIKESILQRFSDILKPGGIFLAGSNQTIVSLGGGFERVEHPAGVFYRQKS